MDADLTILPVKPSPHLKKLKRELHPHLPDIATGQLGIMVSPVKTGKSTIITSLLLNPNFYRDLFDTVYILSNTATQCQTSRFLIEAFPDTVFDDLSRIDEIISNIIDYQTQFPKDKQPFIAVILDDFVGIPANSKIYKLASRFRHYNIGLLLFASQQFKQIPPLVRQNATFLLMGSPNPNDAQLKQIADEYGATYDGSDAFLRMYKAATPEPYDFLYCDLQANPSKAYRNFTDLVYSKSSHTRQEVSPPTPQDDV